MRVWFVFGAWLWVCGGCTCGSPALQLSDGQGVGDGGAQQRPLPPRQSQTKATEYLVRGVVVVTFYPHSQDAKQGALGGYTLLYDKPQKTTLLFHDMADGTCELNRARSRGQRQTYAGLDAGDPLRLTMGHLGWDLKRSPFNPTAPEFGSFYPIPSVEDMSYPYDSQLRLKAPGGPQAQAFDLKLQTPQRLVVTSPTILKTATPISRKQGLQLRWELPSKVPFLAVRINQRNPDQEETLSLSCRFANVGKGAISPTDLSYFAADPKAERTYIYFFSGSYQFPKLKDFEEPLLSVVEAITTSSVKLD